LARDTAEHQCGSWQSWRLPVDSGYLSRILKTDPDGEVLEALLVSQRSV
jgi:hypothetical protein